MSLVHEPGTTPLTQFVVPNRGTWRSVAAHTLGPDVLYDSLNVFIRRGKLRERPGLTLQSDVVFDAPVLGGKMAVTPQEKILLAATKSSMYTFSPTGNNWLLDTSVYLAATDHDTIDTTFIETNNQYVCVIANVHYPLKKWIRAQGVTFVAGQAGQVVPVAKSVCTTAHRIVALVDPHTLRWTATLTYDDWPALATAKIAQTNDTGVCVKQLGTLNFVCYKERSLYVGKAQAGSDAQAFNIQFVQTVEGPAGVNSVVDVGGIHFFMTKSGRVGMFDGTSYVRWIADGLWLFLQEDIDPLYTSKIVAVYDYRLHTVSFHYAKHGDEGLMYGLVIINLPLEGLDLQTANALGLAVAGKTAAFLGLMSKPVSYGYEMRFNQQIDRSLLFTATKGDCQPFIFDDSSRMDDEAYFACMMQTGLFPLPSMKHSQISTETYVERASGNGGMTVAAVTSDLLEDEAGLVTQLPQVIDLNNNPVREYVGFNIPTRFYGLRFDWSSQSRVRYSGTTVFGRELG